MLSAEEGKKQKRALDKEKKCRAKTAKDTTTPGTFPAAIAPAKKDRKNAEFTCDGVRMKGDISRPDAANLNKPRTYTKTDGSGTIQMWYCKVHGYQGLW